MSGEESQEKAGAYRHSDDGVGVFPHRLIRNFGTSDGAISQAIVELPSIPEDVLEPLPGFLDFVSRHMGGGGHEGAGILRERFHVVADAVQVLGYTGIGFHGQFSSRVGLVWRSIRDQTSYLPSPRRGHGVFPYFSPRNGPEPPNARSSDSSGRPSSAGGGAKVGFYPMDKSPDGSENEDAEKAPRLKVKLPCCASHPDERPPED